MQKLSRHYLLSLLFESSLTKALGLRDTPEQVFKIQSFAPSLCMGSLLFLTHAPFIPAPLSTSPGFHKFKHHLVPYHRLAFSVDTTHKECWVKMGHPLSKTWRVHFDNILS